MSLPAYAEYKDSGVEWLGDVPKHWDLKKIFHSFASIGSGTTPKSDEEKWYSDDGVPWVTTGELRENTIFNTTKHVTHTAVLSHSALKLHPAGSLVMAMYGATIGRLGILGVDAVTNQACCVLSGGKNLDIKYVYYWLHVFKETIISLYSTGGGQPNINQENVTSLRVSAPDVPEQTTIARFLDHETAKIDALIAEQQRLIELLKEKRQAVISHAVTKGLDPNASMKDSGVEWLGDVPEHWDVKKLSYLTSKIGSGKTPLGGAEVYSDSGVLFIRSQNVYDDGLRLDDVSYISEEINKNMSNSEVKGNDILLNVTGASIGRTCLVPEVFERANVNQHVCIIRLIKSKYASFISLFLKTQIIKNTIDFHQNGAAREGMNFDQIGGFNIPFPPMSEQSLICTFIEKEAAKIDELINHAHQGIDLLKERRSALISAAVTGKIDVRGWQPPATAVTTPQGQQQILFDD